MLKLLNSEAIEDGKVLASASMAIWLDYAAVFNQLITLLISLCTLIYVSARAYRTIFEYKNTPKAKRRKKK